MRKKYWLVFFVGGMFGVLSNGWAEGKLYSLKDLQSLETRQNWSELIAHLKDIPPSERQKDWSRLVERVCLREDLDSALCETCWMELKSLLQGEPLDLSFAWQAGLWSRTHMAAWAAVPFFAKVLDKPGDSRCGNEDVTLSVVSGLGLPRDRYPDIVTQSQRLAFDTCWPAAREGVMAAFSGNGYVRDNACAGLKSKKALSNLQSKRCDQ